MRQPGFGLIDHIIAKPRPSNVMWTRATKMQRNIYTRAISPHIGKNRCFVTIGLTARIAVVPRRCEALRGAYGSCNQK